MLATNFLFDIATDNNFMSQQLATLFHISDLHFGNQFFNNITFFKKIQSATPLKGFFVHDYQVACALANRINDIKIDRKDNNIPCGVVFTGDLTASGKDLQFITGSNFLRSKIFEYLNCHDEL